MSNSWKSTSIAQCLAESFAGEWGADPVPGNAVVYRATDIDDEGRIVGGGAARRLPMGKLASKALQTGDILLEGSGGGPGKPVGRVAYFDSKTHGGPATCSNFFRTLRPARDHVDPRFLLQKLFWFYRQPPILALQQQTTGIINLKFEGYLASRIEVPELISEQAKIAEILDTLDTAIHETEAIIAKLKAVKQGLLHDLLTRGIDANGELRPLQSEAPHLYKSSLLGWIPNEWTVRALEHCASIAGGVTLGRNLSGGASIELPYLRVANVQDGFLDLVEVKNIRVLKSEIERYELADGDVLMNEGGDCDKLGRGAVWRSQIRPCLHQNHVFRVRCDASVLDPDYLASYTASAGGKKFFLLSAKQSTNLASINSTQLKAFPVPCPELDEQQRIVSAIQSSERKIVDEGRCMSALCDLKSGLMDDLLTGRVRVTPLLDAATP